MRIIFLTTCQEVDLLHHGPDGLGINLEQHFTEGDEE